MVSSKRRARPTVAFCLVTTLVTTLPLACGQEPSFTEERDATSPGSAGDATGVAVEEGAGPEMPASTGADPDDAQADDDDAGDDDDDDDDDDDADATATSTGTDDGTTTDPRTGKLITNNEVWVTEAFELPAVRTVRDTFVNPLEPFVEQSCDQQIQPKTEAAYNVAGPGLRSSAFTKNAPRPETDTLYKAKASKEIDLFVTVDDSESVTSAVIARARTTVKQLVTDLHAYDWKLFLGGLEGASGAYDAVVIAKGTKTLAQAHAAVDQALTDIYRVGSNGDERVFRSLNRLAYDQRNADRDYATHAYLVISDAPNCKDRDNGESGACARTPTRDDHHAYLLTTNGNVQSFMKHKAIFGAYYRQTDGSACSNTDAIEAPLAGETLKLNSQYAALSFDWEKKLYGVSDAAAPSWTGDLCAATESLAWLSRYTAAVADLTDRRLGMHTTADDFGADTQFNFKLVDHVGSTIGGSYYSVKESRLVVVGYDPSGDVTAVYHKLNDYNKVTYAGLLNPEPEDGTVTLAWSGGSTGCPKADAFAGAAAAANCRFAGTTLYLKSLAFLPAVAPGGAPLSVSVQWYNRVPRVRSFTVAAGSNLHLGSLAITTYPAAASALVAGASITPHATDPKQAVVSFAADLPSGDYRVAYRTDAHYVTDCTLTSAVSTGAGAYACYLNPATGALAGTTVTVTPAAGAFACTLIRGSGATPSKVRFGGIVPIDPDTDKPTVLIGYRTVNEPRKTFTMRFAPDPDSLVAELGELGSTGSALEASDFTATQNVLSLTDALYPGQQLDLTYRVSPPLRDCFTLGGKAAKGYSYEVTYGGLEDAEAPAALTAADFTLSDDARPRLCLAAPLVEHGHVVHVTYLKTKTHTEAALD